MSHSMIYKKAEKVCKHSNKAGVLGYRIGKNYEIKNSNEKKQILVFKIREKNTFGTHYEVFEKIPSEVKELIEQQYQKLDLEEKI